MEAFQRLFHTASAPSPESPPRKRPRRDAPGLNESAASLTGVGPTAQRPTVSLIIPAHNAAPWIDECLAAIASQSYPAALLEVSLFDDASTDATAEKLRAWAPRLRAKGVACVLGRRQEGSDVEQEETGPTRRARGFEGPGGCGYAKNRAVQQSRGTVLCFQDADDIMYPDRVERQVDALVRSGDEDALIGAGFNRDPPDAMAHYTRWANGLSPEGLWLEQFRECTVIMPTWLLHRRTFDAVGDFDEVDPQEGEAEDLRWFHRFLRYRAGRRDCLHRVGGLGDPLLCYRYHGGSGSWRSSRKKLLQIRVTAFQERILDEAANPDGSRWRNFAIWGSGRDGKHFYGMLAPEHRDKVTCMIDIDPKRIGTVYVNGALQPVRKVPIVHFRDVDPAVTTAVVVCVARRAPEDRKGSAARQKEEGAGDEDDLEANVASLGLEEGKDLWFFV